LKNGKSHTGLKLKRWRRSSAELALSSARLWKSCGRRGVRMVEKTSDVELSMR
jgi:hypothetical protein